MFGIPGTPSIPGEPTDYLIDKLAGGGGQGAFTPPGGNGNEAAAAQAQAAKEAAIAQSNALLQSAQLQAATMQLGILQNSLNSQFQMTAWLTERLDSNDTKLQIAVEQAKVDFADQSNRHVERMEELRLQSLELKHTLAGKSAGSPDIPEPDFY